MPRPVAVLITLHIRDDLALFERALRSIEAQETGREVRIHLGCDGPLTPGQEAWLHSNGHRFHRIERTAACRGLAAALNRLIDGLEEEEFVFRMDGDDISLPGRFARQIALLEEDRGLSLAGAQAEDIDDEGRVLGPRRFPTGPREIRAALHRANPVLHPSICFRRAIFSDPRVRYPQAHLCEDLALLVALHALGHRAANHPEVLLQWRTGAGFYRRRRDPRRGLAEMTWHFRALRLDHARLTPRAIYPLMRLLLRLLPAGVVERLYRSGLRAAVLGRPRRATPP